MVEIAMVFPAASFLARNLPYVLIAVLAVNLVQRRHQEETLKKRTATLYFAILVFLLMVSSILIRRFELPDPVLIPVVLGIGLLAYLGREKLFLFRLHCRKCGRNLPLRRIIFFDSNLCEFYDHEEVPHEESG